MINNLLKNQHLSYWLRWLSVSFYELKSEYGRTRLGIIWLPMSTILFVIALTIIFARAEGSSIWSYFLYVSVGYSLWQFIAETINQSTKTLQRQSEFAIHNRMTVFDLFVKNVLDRKAKLLLNIIPALVIFVYLDWDRLWYFIPLFPVFLVFLFLTALALSYTINIITLFHPDAERLFLLATRFLFFLSPIFWSATATDAGNAREILLTYNPVAYFLTSFRQLFAIEPLNITSLGITLGIALALWATAGLLHYRFGEFTRNLR